MFFTLNLLMQTENAEHRYIQEFGDAFAVNESREL
jgi:hypothetical protein